MITKKHFLFFCAFAFFILSNELLAQQDSVKKIKDAVQNVQGTETIFKREITKKIYDLKFIDFNNNPFQIDTANAKCIVLNIWATWCPPCVAEISAYNDMVKKYKNCKVDFIAISYMEDTVRTKKYLKIHPYHFKQLISSREYIQENNLIEGLPTTLFIDKKGNVLFNFSGGFEEPDKQDYTIERFNKGMEMIGCH